MRAKPTKSDSTASESASELPTENSYDRQAEVALSDEPLFTGLYRSSRGAYCVVIGFATTIETNETVVAFVGLDSGKHYTMKLRIWLTPTSDHQNEKRFTRIMAEGIRT